MKAAGFEQELSGDEIPPVTAYRLGTPAVGFFAEFLTPLAGDGTRRTGHADATMKAAGITAQKVRYLELLLASPWTVDAVYVHDTLELFGGQLTALRALWVTELMPAWPAKTVERLTRCRLGQHGSVTDVHRAAVRIPQDRTIAPDLLQARCALGLKEIFGD